MNSPRSIEKGPIVRLQYPFRSVNIKQFAIAITGTFVLLQLIFLGVYSYLFGSLYKTSSRVSSLNVLYVDYDGGLIGQSLEAASQQLSGPSFPTFQKSDQSIYPVQQGIIDAVKHEEYWAAIFTAPNASTRLGTAIGQGGNAAVEYNTGPPVVTWVWNEARYAAVQESYILANMQALLGATRGALYGLSASNPMGTVNFSDPAALQAFVNPILSNSVNIQPTDQGTRVLYNTASTVMPPLISFFFLMALNSISNEFGLMTKVSIPINGAIRLFIGFFFTFVAGLGETAFIWAFREEWAVSSRQFMLTWLVLWLCNAVNFAVFECVTSVIPVAFLPFFVLSWIFINITSTVWPFVLSPGFYKVGYAVPAFETWQLLIDIWTSSANTTNRALPILFAWLIVLAPLSVLAVIRRCKKAKAMEAMREEEVHAKVQEAVMRAKRNRVSPPASVEGESGWRDADQEMVQRTG